jgi:hypothetical protein
VLDDFSKQLQALLGRHLKSKEIQDFLKTLKGKRQIDKFDTLYFYTYKEHGMDLRFNKDDTLITLFFFGKDEDHNEYKGPLPIGLSFNDTLSDVERKLGKPTNSGGRAGAEYEASYPKLGISVTYADKHHSSDSRIKHIVLTKPWRARYAGRSTEAVSKVPEKRDSSGLTELMLAVRSGLESEVNSQIEYGADVNAKDVYGETPLIMASFAGQRNIAEILIEKGADVNVRDGEGETALIVAARKGHKDVTETLIANGADVNAKNNKGFTAMVFAASGGYKEVVELLLANKADANIEGTEGMTALAVAKLNKHYDIPSLLEAAGAKKEDYTKLEAGINREVENSGFCIGHTTVASER